MKLPCCVALMPVVLVWLHTGCGRQVTPSVTPESKDTSVTPPLPPVAAKRPYQVASPHGTREDPYYWLRDDTRKDPDVLGYLRAENAYTRAVLRPTKPLQEMLYREMVSRIAEDDTTVPAFDDGYWYYTRYEAGKEYPIYARRKGSLDASEEILIDANALARGHEFYAVGDMDVSPDGALLAFTEDTVGRNQYTLRIKDLGTGALLLDTKHDISSSVVWAGDNRTILYVARHPTTLMPYRVHKHELGTDPGRDPLVYEERDGAFYTDIDKSKSDEYIFIASDSARSSEVRVARADDPTLAFQVFLPREPDHEYSIEHVDQRFIVRTNWKAKNFRIMEVPIARIGNKDAWKELIGHRDDALINDFDVFSEFLAVSERQGGLLKIRVQPWRGGKPVHIDADEAAYTTALDEAPELDSTTLRYTYTSLTTPPTVYDYDMRTGEKMLLKRHPVPGSYSPDAYATEYVYAPARDGERIPVLLTYRKGVRKDGTAPLYVMGYGAYGTTQDPEFDCGRVSLLDRGFVIAIAHIRGSEALGRRWYEAGKLLEKKNTFHDFMDVTEFLIAEKYAARDKVFARGASAGGLVMGVIANMRPDLYRGIIAHVPFVDAVTTMLDEDIPLTTEELGEWGNPKEREYYEYILSYSPYDNVKAHDYPAMFVTTGLWDSQVQYFEPAKWVARLRATKTDSNPLLLHVDMSAGHSGRSGRYDAIRERAMEYAFILHVLGRDT